MSTPRRTVVHPRATARPPKKGPFSYLLPFLVIIGLGILAVLIYNFMSQGPSLPGGSSAQAALTLDGTAQVKAWGQDTYTDAHDGDILYAGDQIEVGADGLATLTLSDESVIRLDADSSLKIDSLEPQTKKLAATLEGGKAWFNLATEQDLLLTTPSALTSAGKGIFGAELGKDSTTLYSVVGALETSLVQEKADGRTTVLQKFMVQTNEQLTITPDKLAYLVSGGTTTPAADDTTTADDDTTSEEPIAPKFIEPVSEEITGSTWYQDNLALDGRDDLLETGDDDDDTTVADDDEEDTTEEEEDTVKEEEPEEVTKPETETSTLTAPKITSPKNGATITTESFILSGTVSKATAKVIVTNSAQGTPYALSRYTAGSTSWNYNAAVAFGNMKEGKNTYTVVAVDADGKESAAASITITYQASATAETTTTPETKPTEPAKEETPATPEKITPSTPAITIPASSATYEAAVSELAIGGSVDANTSKLYVNGVAIAYTAGSTRWSTIVPLVSGANIFSVMAESKDGTRSAPSMITINFK